MAEAAPEAGRITAITLAHLSTRTIEKGGGNMIEGEGVGVRLFMAAVTTRSMTCCRAKVRTSRGLFLGGDSDCL